MNDGTSTPRQDDAGNIRAVIGAMTQTLSSLEQSFLSLNTASTQLAGIGPSSQDVLQDIQTLRKQVREGNKKGVREIEECNRVARDDVKQQIAANLKDDILEQIQKEIAAQVQQQVDVQIQEHIPISLKQQSTINKTRISEARISLTNSAARKLNAGFRVQNLDESLAVVLRGDGTRGKLYPADLRSLLSYDAGSVRELNSEYELAVDEVREVNLNRFLGHIGILFEVVVG
ncbi:hypothetical protein FB45DRAFT_894020 [Roridomyces roridus]|uniref:Uncharacterized protein n=1 Tax=Roridomyces roridus TaxID=1738132 RepID=A0AAD7FX42_9AGAR|nr:hypothetical protein FB45DRAFT_894020 [Roridomyces roridus]